MSASLIVLKQEDLWEDSPKGGRGLGSSAKGVRYRSETNDNAGDIVLKSGAT